MPKTMSLCFSSKRRGTIKYSSLTGVGMVTGMGTQATVVTAIALLILRTVAVRDIHTAV